MVVQGMLSTQIGTCQRGGRKLTQPESSPCFGFATTEPKCVYNTLHKVSRHRVQEAKREISSVSEVFYATFLMN